MPVSQHSIFDGKKAVSGQRSDLFLANADQTRRAAAAMPCLLRDADPRVQDLHHNTVRAIAEIGRQLNTLGVFHGASSQRANTTPAAAIDSKPKQVLQSVATCPAALLSVSPCAEAPKTVVLAQAAAAAA